MPQRAIHEMTSQFYLCRTMRAPARPVASSFAPLLGLRMLTRVG